VSDAAAESRRGHRLLFFGFFGFSIYPVAMELSVECSYPVGEATSAGLVFVSGQVQSVVYIVLLQALTTRLADSPLSTCGEAALSWKVPMMVMAGLCTLFTCCFLVFFNTRYRRLEAEEQATYGTRESQHLYRNEQPPWRRKAADNTEETCHYE
uniref:solute carrier family 49 member A3-like n=1 Tax=Maylandia zebra TaxID=106582 RepID=UPI000D315D34